MNCCISGVHCQLNSQLNAQRAMPPPHVDLVGIRNGNGWQNGVESGRQPMQARQMTMRYGEGHLPGNQRGIAAPLTHRTPLLGAVLIAFLHFGWANIAIVKSTIVWSGPGEEWLNMVSYFGPKGLWQHVCAPQLLLPSGLIPVNSITEDFYTSLSCHGLFNSTGQIKGRVSGYV